jgi:hypothetical protein
MAQAICFLEVVTVLGHGIRSYSALPSKPSTGIEPSELESGSEQSRRFVQVVQGLADSVVDVVDAGVGAAISARRDAIHNE